MILWVFLGQVLAAGDREPAEKAVRKADFRKGTRPGKDDHLVCWKKPTSIRSVDRETYRSLRDSTTVREARSRVEQPGFRTRSIVMLTTLLDPE